MRYVALEPNLFPKNGRVVRLKLPWPPSVNMAYKTVVLPRRVRGRGGKIKTVHIAIRAKSKLAREYQERVSKSLKAKNIKSFGSARLKVTVCILEPDRRQRDVANYDKVLMDTLVVAGIFDDDSQVDDIRFLRGAIKKPGRVEVTIEEI